MNKPSLLLLLLIFIGVAAQSQKMKVKRKGVTPLDVSKNSPASQSKNSPSQSRYSLQQFSGKWQEVGRTDSKTNSSVAFKDTSFYDISANGNVFSRDGVNMSLMGEAAIEPGNVLVAAADVFTIKSLNNNQAVLDDGDYIHTFVKKKQFWSETLPSNTVAREKFTTPVSVNASALTGRWKVYRRDAKPGKENNRTLIRILNITNSTNENTASGEITFYRTEKLETLPCTISIDGERMQITAGQNTWDVNIYKADRNDLVFGDASLMYHCKPL